MNHSLPEHELISRCIDGFATDDELERAESLLLEDENFRSEYLSYLNVHDALFKSVPTDPSHQIVMPSSLAPNAEGSARWQFAPARSVMHAMLGLILGVLCSSFAWAMVISNAGEQSKTFWLLYEPFDNANDFIASGFPSQPDVWGGDQAIAIPFKDEQGSEVNGFVLKLEPSEKNKLSYIQQVFDLNDRSISDLATMDEMVVLEVNAEFLTENPGFRERYNIRMATFAEPIDKIEEIWNLYSWNELRQYALTMSKAGLNAEADAQGWQAIHGSVRIPPNAKSLVISLAAGRLDEDVPKTAHLIDNVDARLVVQTKQEAAQKRRNRKRKKRKIRDRN